MSRRKAYTDLHNAPKKGKAIWRSLEEKYADPADLQRSAESERPGGFARGLIGAGALKKRAAEKKRSRRVSNTAETQNDLLRSQPKVSRRGFLAGGAAGALTLSGCARRPVEHILPYVEGPEYQLPGQPIHFASVTKRGDDALGLLVTSHVGRPTKIEGNPRHSRSLGATDLRAQLAIWDLYDPDRSQGPAERSGEAGLEDRSVAQFDAALDAAIASHAERGGTGLRVLMEPTNSPSMVRIRRRLAERFPQAKVHTYTSIDTDNAREGGELAFGQPVSVVYNLSGADVVLALDSDFLGDEHGSVRNGKAFASRRKITNPESDRMNRLYAVEGNFSLTGANADHRLRLPPRQIGGFLKALAAVIDDGPVPEAFGDQRAFLQALAADLKSAGARGLILVGRRQPPAVHAAAHALNDRLGAYGSSPADRARLASFQTVTVDERKRGTESIAELASATDVQTLLIFGVNGVYNAPADVDFTGLLARNGVKSFYFGSHRDETAQRCSWHYPLAHELESWGDQRAADGTVSVQQPLIQPLWGGRSALEVLAKAAGERNWRGHYVVRKTFRDSTNLGDGFEARWRAALHNGVVAGSMTRPIRPPLQAAARSALDSLETVAAPTAQDLEVVFAADPRVWDGRHTNNLWALESPDPITKMVWDNAALMSRATMEALSLSNGDMVTLSKGERRIDVPAYGVPGQADFVVTLHLGWGRTAAGRYGNAQEHDGLGLVVSVERDWYAGGFDVHPLRASDAFYFTGGVSAQATGDEYWLVTTQTHDSMEGRPIAIDATLAEYRAEPEFASYRTVEMDAIGPLWDQVDYSPREVATGRTLMKWGMVIDLSACHGCGACSIACQAENNIPAVGKQEVARGREMTWLRIDRYFTGDDEDNPEVALQPVGCQHCEEAPCENVCPVNATVHSPEGMNDMAYNRCIGTRYCANNCPYKVRRFNYLDWHSHLDNPWTMHGNFPHVRKMAFNPNVTVRMRGVMEKCSYCVQRIQEAKFEARRNQRQVRDGDIVTACQQVCAAEAIVFGDLNDPESRVAQADATNRRYKLLAEVGAQPRTTFLGKIRNPNPDLEPVQAEPTEGEAH